MDRGSLFINGKEEGMDEMNEMVRHDSEHEGCIHELANRESHIEYLEKQLSECRESKVRMAITIEKLTRDRGPYLEGIDR